ncbi:MAG TPA: HAD-IC family P-type ATPase, partial [Patescibacteria group bacterium]|nr:HAD-IC family P-type ATPase [Patescibacteria group bacterium]
KGGLTDAEARRRLERFGPNELAVRKLEAWRVFLRQFRSPMVYLLAAAAALSFAFEAHADGITIAVILLINASIGFWQEYHSEKAVQKLREKLAARARVRRDGDIVAVERRALVPGDVVLLEPGDVVDADVRLCVSHRLTIDESTLTGESIAVEKTAGPDVVNGKEHALNMAHMMTRVAAGYGEGVVIATGADTIIGTIAKLTEETPRVSAFERNLQEFSAFLLKAVGVVLGVVFVVNVFLKGESQIVPQFLFAAALAVSVVPEALPAVSSFTLARGALKLAKRHVVVKRLSAIEDLGHIEVLCTDKTGTLTEGRMSVAEVRAADRAKALRFALAAASEEELRKLDVAPKTFDAAVVAAAGKDAARAALGWKRAWFVPFDPSRRRSSAVFDDGRGPMLVVLGAPEEILARSTTRFGAKEEEPLTPHAVMDEKAAIREEGLRGHRVLALAVKRVEAAAAYGEDVERALAYVGTISFVDPLKSTARSAVADAASLNVRVKILTGDGPEVAGAIGVQTGVIGRVEDVVTGETLDAAPAAEFDRLIEARHVFARITPAQKFKIIQGLERRFQVGFLGEGINDAPALKAANVALAVDHASDVARESADIILLRKDLRVIVDGIREGRAIFTNIVKYVRYTLVGNFGNFIAVAVVSLMIDDLPMLPIQILLVNLLTDLPLISVAADSVDAEEVKLPKRFNLRELAFIAVFLGLVSSFFDFAYFALNRKEGLDAVRTLWFLFSVTTEIALIYSIRTRLPFWKSARPPSSMLVLSVATLLVALAAAYLPFTREIFRFVPPTARQLWGVAALAAAYLVATETVKLAYVKMARPKPAA